MNTLLIENNFVLAEDGSKIPSLNDDIVINSTAIPSPNNDAWNGAGCLHYCLWIETAKINLASGISFEPKISSLITDISYIKIVSNGNFDVTYRKVSGTNQIFNCVGSTNLFGECSFPANTLEYLKIENNTSESLEIQVLIAVIVNYDDIRLEGQEGIPLTGFAGTGYNASVSPGILPLGAIIPVAGTFTASNNTGAYSETSVTPINNWLKHCDGSVINDVLSPLNGKYVPNLSDDRFVMGATTGGTIGGATSVTVSVSVSYTNEELTTAEQTYTPPVDPSYNAAIAIPSKSFNSSAIDIRPKYLALKYYMRVK